MKNYPGRDHAIVIGSGMGGMVCARVLSEHFSKVTIIEKDPLPESPATRKSVPQGHFLHILLAKGVRVLDDLFPELFSSLESAGAVRFNVGQDIAAKMSNGRIPRYQSDIWLYGCSRPLLEWHIHQQLTAISNIQIMEQSEVKSLLYDRDTNCVTGVSLQQNKDAQHDVVADIVVDSGGRTAKTLKWFEALGFDKPEETIIQPPVVYSCRAFKKPANFKSDWKLLAVYPDDVGSSSGGFVNPIENDQWMVTLWGVGQALSRDDSLFLEFARSLPSPDLYNAIKYAEPISSVYTRRKTVSRINHFEKLDKRPEKFFAVGDTVCSYNPVYGQGMTSAVLGAVTLGETFADHPKDTPHLAGIFHKKLAEVNIQIWQRGTMDDLRWSDTLDENPTLKNEIEVRTKFMERIWELAIHDTQVAELVWSVMHFLKPVNELMTLEIQSKLAKYEAEKMQAGISQAKIWHSRSDLTSVRGKGKEIEARPQQSNGKTITSEQLNEIAEHWVNGGRVDWKNLHQETTPQKLHLPTYPFEKERFCIARERSAETSLADNKQSQAENTARGTDKISANLAEQLSREELHTETPSTKTTLVETPESEEPSYELPIIEKISLFLKIEIAEQLALSVTDVDSTRGYFELGLDSLGFLMLIEKIQNVIGEKLPPEKLFEYVTIDQLSGYLHEKYEEQFQHWSAPETFAGAAVETQEEKEKPSVDENKPAVTPELKSIKDKSTTSKNSTVDTTTSKNTRLGKSESELERSPRTAKKSTAKAAVTKNAPLKDSRAKSTSKFPELIHLNKANQGRPVFWIHGGIGGVQPYYYIAEGLQRPFYGIQAKGKIRTSTSSMKSVAAYYIRIIKSVQPQGPYDLGGYSLGGLICYEITRQLQRNGDKVSSIVMLDTLDTSGLEKVRSSIKSQQLLYVNLTLASRVMHDPRKFSEALIHHNELDESLDPKKFKEQLLDIAEKKGLISRKHIQEKVEEMAGEEEDYNVDHYTVAPLRSPRDVRCYYFRNKSGLFFGELEPYFTISSDKSRVDKTNYWHEWEENLHDFHILDVDTPNHMNFLLEDHVYKTITEFCHGLYSQKGITDKSLETFKQQLKEQHGVLQHSPDDYSRSGFISRLLSNITGRKSKADVDPA
ncbi:thioesterase domain-containing protein [Teredinibacter haidensis]|uniref:thioesterase domain-containing protein n=1 Tax=Teredinibacter haidensis TaxID=2731755 RepID=UPI000948AB47|nr:thioesterase domain-containing protein [Teredinibacter haidensis]